MAKSDDMDLLAADMDDLANDIPKVGPLLIGIVAGAVHRELVTNTPVDTGKARSNWIMSVQPVDTVIDPYRPYPKFSGPKFSETDNANAAISQGEAVLSSFSGNTIYIQNNVPYIGLLNDGSSAQSPALFVETAIQAGIKALEGINITVI